MTKQIEFWQSDFGRKYTDRSPQTAAEQDALSKKNFGLTQEKMNLKFFKELPIESILEVGCNVGSQLQVVQKQGYEKLYGIEAQPYAVEKGKKLSIGINIIQGSALDLPFKDDYFDLLFTYGVLIHISPDDITQVLSEIYRVSKRFIWGFEYFCKNYQPLDYRGNEGFLWKGDFGKMYQDLFPSLKLIKQID